MRLDTHVTSAKQTTRSDLSESDQTEDQGEKEGIILK